MDQNYNNYNNNNNNSSYNPYDNYGYQNTSENTWQGTYQTGTYQQGGYQQEPPRKKKGFEEFGVTLVKTVAIALVFGLVAGAAGSTVLRLNGFTPERLENMDKDNLSDTETTDEDIIANEESPTKGDANALQQTDTDVIIGAVMDVSDIVENTMPCVVAINNTSEVTYQGRWGQTYTQESQSAGTGFIVKQDKQYIYIATNNHVVADATKLEVQFCDGSIAEAEIKGTVASKDLAVIKVSIGKIEKETMREIRVATLGDSNELEVGEAAIAIGNALGYGQSVTTGVISATGRSVTVQDSSTGSYVVNNNLIQTDAAINPGNSGGALLNIEGEVIGINSVKYADTQVEGIGYAIPINDAMLIVNKLIEGEKIDESQSGYLGIQGQDSNLGAYVYSVFEGSAAEEAGIQAGDVIIEFEGTDIATMSQLKELLSYYPAGEEVEFVILRPQENDEYTELKVTVTLGDASILPSS